MLKKNEYPELLEKSKEKYPNLNKRKDKLLFLLLCVLTSTLISLAANEVRMRYTYRTYIKETYNNSVEAVNALHKLDSTYYQINE